MTSYEDALAVLTTSSFRQIAHTPPAPSAALLDGTTITLHGREHLARRRLENPLFEPRQLAHYERVAADALDRELRRVHAGADGGAFASLDLVPFVRPVVARVGAAVVGLDVDEQDAFERFAAFARAFEDAVQDADFRTGALDAAFWHGFDRAELARFRRELVDPSWARRRALLAARRDGTLERSAPPVDLLSLLALDAEAWEADDVVREVVLYIIGSTGTSTQGVFESVVALAGWLERHPEDQGRLTAEGGRAFVAAACTEAIRLRPPPPSLIRVADHDAELPSGLRVEAGQVVHVDLHAANTDAAWFEPTPCEFDPHRRPRDTARPFGLAFGAGSHMCIGQRLASGRGHARGGPGEPLGLVPLVVLTLLRAGLELDPQQHERLKQGTLRRMHLELPVRFERRALAAHLGRSARPDDETISR